MHFDFDYGLKEILCTFGGALLVVAAHYIRTGRVPIFDPGNRHKLFDLFRDAVREALKDSAADDDDDEPPPRLHFPGPAA